MPDTVFFSGHARHDTVLFVDQNRCAPDSIKDISQITWVGVLVNLFLAVTKGVFGVLASSSALVADAAHTVSDLVSDAIILVGVRFWSAPPDAEHPHGHRKIETVATLCICLLVIAVAVGMGYRAVGELAAALTREGGRAPKAAGPAVWAAFAVAIVSMVAKELLYRWTAARGVKLESAAVVANAWHHRSDALSSIPPALAIGGGALGARLGHDLWYLDPLGTLIVCVMLLQAAWEIMRPSLSALLDASAERQLCSAIRKAVLATPGVVDAHRIRTRCLAPNAVAVDLNIHVRGDLTVCEGHDIAVDVGKRVMRVRIPKCHRPVDVMVHIEPAEPCDRPFLPGRRESDTMKDWKEREL